MLVSSSVLDVTTEGLVDGHGCSPLVSDVIQLCVRRTETDRRSTSHCHALVTVRIVLDAP